MAWIESHQSLRLHPKTRKLARELGISLPQAIGHLHCLWWWALDYAQDGDLSRYEDDEIADGAEWQGEPAAFMESLRRCGFITDGALHDWHDYAGKLVERREKNRERMRQARNADAASTCNARATHVQDTCEATIPDQTVPYTTLTPPYSPPPTGGDGQIYPQLPVENDNGSKPAKHKDDDETFALFYSAYPRHEARAPAEKAWRRLTKAERQEAISAAKRMAEHIRSHAIDLHLVALPATWLHQRRWEDWRDGRVPAHYQVRKDGGMSASEIYAMALETEAKERGDKGWQ